MTFRERNALFLRTALDVLKEAARPLARRDVMDRVGERLEFTTDETDSDSRGQARWQVQLDFRTSEAAKIGWMTKSGGWRITEAGIRALSEYDGIELFRELRRLYGIRSTAAAGRRYTDPRWERVIEALASVPEGYWTTYGDLAELVGMSAQSVGGFMAEAEAGNGYRVLRSDGTISPDFRWWNPDRTDDPREVLESEGVEFDERGRANPAQRVTAEDFLALLGDDEPETPTHRAWLVRGSAVDGSDLISVWLLRGTASLAASNLRPITPPIPRDELRSIVETDYQHKSYAVRAGKVAEFDAFCNRMRPGDYVLTTSQGKTFVGRITGEAMYTQSSDKRSNLRRTVDWLNSTRGVPFANLPQPLPAKLHSQSDVVELTENIAAIEALLTELGIPIEEPKQRLELDRFPEVSEELAKQLLIDRAWLQRFVELLWDRKQVIFYGPPGTGKTYLARKLADYLAEPSAVKLVQFHPSYTYEDFFEGFRPMQDGDGKLVFDIRQGPLRQLVEVAKPNPTKPYILIIDEINRANLPKVFGELYFSLEYRDQPVSLMYSTEETNFTLPPNLFVVGTMNTTDRSIALVDAAIRRRFAFVELHPSQPPVKGLLTAWLAERQQAGELKYNSDAPQVLDALNAQIADHDMAIGPSYLMRPEIYQHDDGLDRVWETSILPLLAEYHYGRGAAQLDRYKLAELRGQSESS